MLLCHSVLGEWGATAYLTLNLDADEPSDSRSSQSISGQKSSGSQ
jgi:hypothetical protein